MKLKGSWRIEEASIGVVLLGDAADIMWENEKLDYVVPEEGSNLWFDNMVISKAPKMWREPTYLLILCLMQKMQLKIQSTSVIQHQIKKLFSTFPEEVVSYERFYPDEEINWEA